MHSAFESSTFFGIDATCLPVRGACQHAGPASTGRKHASGALAARPPALGPPCCSPLYPLVAPSVSLINTTSYNEVMLLVAALGSAVCVWVLLESIRALPAHAHVLLARHWQPALPPPHLCRRSSILG